MINIYNISHNEFQLTISVVFNSIYKMILSLSVKVMLYEKKNPSCITKKS